MRWLSVLLVSLTVVTSLRDEGGPPLDDVISSTGERDDESPTTDRERECYGHRHLKLDVYGCGIQQLARNRTHVA